MISDLPPTRGNKFSRRTLCKILDKGETSTVFGKEKIETSSEFLRAFNWSYLREIIKFRKWAFESKWTDTRVRNGKNFTNQFDLNQEQFQYSGQKIQVCCS